MCRQFKTDFTKETYRQVDRDKTKLVVEDKQSIESYRLQKRLVDRI